MMTMAQKCFDECHDVNETFVYCTMNAVKCEVVPFFDVYSAPFFKFSDGSLIEFVIEYNREILSATPYIDLMDMCEHGHRWAA